MAKAAGHDVDGSVDERGDFPELAVAFDAEAGGPLWDAAVFNGLSKAEVLIEFGRHGQLDDVDWGHQALVLWRSGESGSCPETLVDVGTNADGTVEVATDRDTGPGMGCTGDYNPYRMVVTVDRDRLPNADELPAELDGVPRGQATTWS